MVGEQFLNYFVKSVIADKPYLDRFCDAMDVRLIWVGLNLGYKGTPIYFFKGKAMELKGITLETIMKSLDKLPS